MTLVSSFVKQHVRHLL